MTDKPWYVEITRDAQDPDDPSKIGDPIESIVIGPFDSKDVAMAYMDSADVDDWVTDEAKKNLYIVDDVFITQTPAVPEVGINSPVLMYIEGTPEHEAAFGEPSEQITEDAMPAVGLRLLAHYPMMGDEDGVLWAESMFTHAKAEGLITGFKVLHSQRTVFGVQDIVFYVDIDWSGPVSFHATFEQAKEVAANWLNGTLIGDSDVDLLSLSPLHPADITTEV